jgi:hypothetical protein
VGLQNGKWQRIGGSHRGGGKRQRRRSKMHRGPWWLGRRHGRDACSLGHGRRREGVAGGAVRAESNGGAGKNSAGDGANVLLKWRSGEATEGGLATRVPRRAIWPWGLAPIGGRCPDRVLDRPRRARAARLCSSGGAPGVADAWAPAGSERGREERGAGARGPTQRKRKVGRARMNSDDF